MKWSKLGLVFGLLVSCTLVEPESQSNLVIQTYIFPGPLDSIDFFFSFFDEDEGLEISVPELEGVVSVFGKKGSSFPLRYQEGNSFRLENSGEIIYPGDSINVIAQWKNFQLEANTLVPSRPNNIKLFPNILKLGSLFEGSPINLIWEPENSSFLIAKIFTEDSIPFPSSYVASWPEDRVLLSNQRPENDGNIFIRPWDFPGTGNYKVLVYWFNQSASDLYNNPIQSGIFSAGHGIDHGLGYFHSFDADTFSVQLTF
jgi:hypothetical protein